MQKRLISDEEAYLAFIDGHIAHLGVNTWEYKYLHMYPPERYPCVIVYHTADDPNGGFHLDFEFVYLIGDFDAN